MLTAREPLAGMVPLKPLTVAVILAATIFLVDLSLPLGVAGGVPYVALVLVGLWAPTNAFILALATVGTALTIVAWHYSPDGGIPWVVLTNRALALFAIWITAILIIGVKLGAAVRAPPTGVMRLKLLTVAIALLSIAAVGGMVVIGSTTVVRFDTIHSDWRTLHESAETKGYHLNEIRGYLGYGGFIHDFKNYVLRHDDELIERIDEHLARLRTAMRRYEEQGVTREEAAALSDIRAVIDDYEVSLDVAKQSAVVGRGAAETDRLVTVDDRPAVAAIAVLMRSWRQARERNKADLSRVVEEGRRSVQTGLYFLPVPILVVFLLIWMLRRLTNEIAERERTSSALRGSEERLRNITANVPGIVYQRVLHPDGGITFPFVNEGVRHILGHEPDAVVADPSLIIELIHPDDREGYRAALHRSARTLEPLTMEFRINHPSGELKWVRSISRPRPRADGAIVWDSFMLDITERIAAEEAVRKTEQQLRSIIDHSPSIIYLRDLNSCILIINRKYQEWYKVTQEEAWGKTGEEWLGKDNVQKLMRSDKAVIASKQPSEQEFQSTDDHGHHRYVRSVKFPVFDNAGNVVGIGGIGTDISPRRRSEMALAESEKRYRQLIDMSPDSIYVQVDGHIVFANAVARDQFGAGSYDQMIGLESIKLICPEFREIIETRRAEVFNSKKLPPFLQLRYRRLDGSTFEAEGISIAMVWNGEPALLIVVRDISARKQAEQEKAGLEQRLRQAQKMEALGTLAGGTAHEFNNLLVPIMCFTELAMREVPDESRAFQNLDRVLKSSHRAAQLIEKILSFSRTDEAVVEPIDLRRVVEEAVELLRPSLPATVMISTELSVENCMVLSDATQIHQIILNLATNAAHAMEGRVGKLVIGLANVEFDNGFVGNFARLDQGFFARIFFTDNGCGIDEQTMPRLFEPFFTTKEVGKGTGLGLAMIHGIVGSHGGGIEVTSEPGRGTTVDVYLPLLKEGETALAVEG